MTFPSAYTCMIRLHWPLQYTAAPIISEPKRHPSPMRQVAGFLADLQANIHGTEREANIHFARVNLAMSRAFRVRALPRCHYHWSLLESAANARRRAMAARLPVQSELF